MQPACPGLQASTVINLNLALSSDDRMLGASIEHVRISILEIEENRPMLRFNLEGQITRPWDRGTIKDQASTAKSRTGLYWLSFYRIAPASSNLVQLSSLVARNIPCRGADACMEWLMRYDKKTNLTRGQRQPVVVPYRKEPKLQIPRKP